MDDMSVSVSVSADICVKLYSGKYVSLLIRFVSLFYCVLFYILVSRIVLLKRYFSYLFDFFSYRCYL